MTNIIIGPFRRTTPGAAPPALHAWAEANGFGPILDAREVIQDAYTFLGSDGSQHVGTSSTVVASLSRTGRLTMDDGAMTPETARPAWDLAFAARQVTPRKVAGSGTKSRASRTTTTAMAHAAL